MPQEKRGSLNSESLHAIAAFMQGLDELSGEAKVEIVGLVDITVDGQPAGQLDCAAGTETVWAGA